MADYVLSAKITGDAREFIKSFGSAGDALSKLSEKSKEVGQKVSDLGKKVNGIGDTLTRKITMPAIGAASALAGITLVKGFNRLVGIDEAKAKLKGLGHDAKSVEEIMKSALESVKGTAHGMDEAATTAASAVAAGIKPGKELTRYLSLTGDAAAIAGASMAEMGSIINQVQTSQVAYTDNLNQLADRGIPIYQWLGDEAGVAASEVKEMASEGKISSEMFLAAIEKNIGGAAKTMGEESFKAAVKNIGADISRIGANFLDAGGKAGGFFSTVKPLLTEFRGVLAQVEGKAAELGVKFGAAFNSVLEKVREVKAWFDGLSPTVQSFITKAAGIGAVLLVGLGPALQLAGFLTTGFGSLITIFGVLMSPIGLVIGGIVALIGYIGYLMATNETFRVNAMSVFGAIGGKIKGVFGTISEIIQATFPIFTTLFSSIIAGFQNVAGEGTGFSTQLSAILLGLSPIVKLVVMLFQNFGPQIVAAFQGIVTTLIPAFATLGTAIGQLAGTILPVVMSVLQTLIPIVIQVGMTFMSIIQNVLPVVISLFNQLVPIIMQVVQIVAEIIAQVVPLVGVLISALLPVIQSVIVAFMNIVQAVAPAFIAIIGAIMSVIKALLPIIMSIITVVVEVVANIISVVSPLVAFIAGIISAIMSVIAPIIVFIANVIATVIDIIRPIIIVVAGIFNTVFSIISGTFRSVMTFIGSAINSIGTVISGLSSVVSGVFNTIRGTIAGIMDRVSGHITGVFSAIRGAWSGLTAFVSGVFSGISGAVSKLVGQVKKFINGVIGGINAAVGLINKIPGVNIGKIPYLARGTDDWQGGFAVMNEGGRGELVNLPNGAQVIPHDVSMRYAREVGRAQASGKPQNNGAQGGGWVLDNLTGRPIIIQIPLNKRVLAEETFEDIRDLLDFDNYRKEQFAR